MHNTPHPSMNTNALFENTLLHPSLRCFSFLRFPEDQRYKFHCTYFKAKQDLSTRSPEELQCRKPVYFNFVLFFFIIKKAESKLFGGGRCLQGALSSVSACYRFKAL